VSLHASQRADWVRASVWEFLRGQDLGADLVPAEAMRANLDRSAPWIRVGFLDLPPSPAGQVDGVYTNRVPVNLLLDVHAPDGSNTDQVNLWAADRIASLCRAAMANADLPLYDYTNPDAPAAVAGVSLIFHTPPPTLQDIGNVNGWIRRRVTARGIYFERLAA